MPIYSTAGAKLFIGGVLPAKSTPMVESDFDGQNWVEVAWVDNLGTSGDTSQEVTFDAIGQNRRIKLKGTRDAGSMSVTAGIDYTDPGQIKMLDAETKPDDFAFKIEFNDAPATGANPRGSLRLFCGKVMSASEALDGANSAMRLNATIGINSNRVRVAATAAAPAN